MASYYLVTPVWNKAQEGEADLPRTSNETEIIKELTTAGNEVPHLTTETELYLKIGLQRFGKRK